MATSTSTELSPKLEDQDVAKHVSDLENVHTEEELEKKLKSMSKFGFSLANWMKVIFNKDTSQYEHKAVWLTDEDYISQAEDCMRNSWRILNLPEWNLEKRGSEKGDVVESKFADEYGKIYRFTGIVDCPAKFLYDEFKDRLHKVPEWNPTILKNEIIKEIAPGIDLSYQITAGGGRGIVAPRDFVLLRQTAKLNKDGNIVEMEDPHGYISSGVSVEIPGFPPKKEFVRGHNKVGCWYIKSCKEQNPKSEPIQKCIFQWLMCCDMKGKIPQFVLDVAFSTVMLEYIGYLRKFVKESKSKGMF